MASNPLGVISFVGEIKLPAALFTKPVRAPPSFHIVSIISLTASETLMSQA